MPPPDEVRHLRASNRRGVGTRRPPPQEATHRKHSSFDNRINREIEGDCHEDSSRLPKNSRRSRCLRHGPGCKASRRRRCLCTSSRSDNTAGGAVPRQPIRAQGIGDHLLCCGSSTMAPHRHPHRASHMAPQASCARPTRVSQPPARAARRRPQPLQVIYPPPIRPTDSRPGMSCYCPRPPCRV